MHLFGKTGPQWFERAGGRQERFEAFTEIGGRHVRVTGTALAREGIAFVSPVRMFGNEMPLTFTIRQRTIPSRVRIIKGETVEASKRLMHRYYCSFITIAADDLDAVVRYVENRPEPKDPPQPLADQDVRTLPRAVFSTIVRRLVESKRLAPTAPGIAPLIRVKAGAFRELGDGRRARDVLVHSRIIVGAFARSYDTKFRVFADERVDQLT